MPPTKQTPDPGLGRQHGGADAQGLAPLDFSTNSNACGPCPQALQAVQQADARHYPDPRYTELRAALAAWHGVPVQRLLLGASGSELIHRIHVWARLHGLRTVAVPRPAYGDYAQQAQALGLQVRHVPHRPVQDGPGPRQAAGEADLQWLCVPSSPLGAADARMIHWMAQAGSPQAARRLLDAAYAPLMLLPDEWPDDELDDGAPDAPGSDGPDWLMGARLRQKACWQLFSPNKALGLTGVRAAYAIAPQLANAAARQSLQAMLAQLDALAPSWPLGAHGVALLQAWMQAPVQQWLAGSRAQLRDWKRAQLALCRSLGWQVLPGSLANYFVVRPGPPQALGAWQQALRAQGIKVRDTGSMGLPGHWRLSVQPPASQQALARAWQALGAGGG
ncbi:aminotransferase class I/II-fold pyridoxal phosphate-dependent enzyme [Vandammella animalimorsus]|uniref:histidinol-phosphate transaminase n=1 Tax=Vandammella animalimorsus TaxID=2029117 RepID=A0A3M6RRL3_9BURK|nr:aminotransferase class I/II-fold pyridoxal phosphate-dependent enzyme [Vandammella animalimorsus]RMX17993.1 aminotransferase class I/II-fold pyridoxal phosphate-dependent enzyme [Vandammella animalimorsus]